MSTPATSPRPTQLPPPSQKGGRIVFRGRLGLTGDGGAMLEVAGTHILFDLAASPPSTAVDGTWVEISVERNSVSLWPYVL
ncbi:hypothetical protein PV749_36305 [Streptomyces sp. ID03-2B]|uniref:hypothetical protein n=1 Tax=Streptomyces sp. ID03-2B TaxID=3028660 RepID=UPI0029AA7CA6|nr:hypothetical protein [Streptomyces sp. ID03-2B]MDX3596600.1 hypothetical protein [Streptomyces sp. ID03-2B]